jgi:octaprenyl-diphosphate synthase
MTPSFYIPISHDLENLETKLFEYLRTPNEPTNQVLKHIFSSGGKRIRPALFLLSSQLIEYQGEHKFSIASVCEYIHTASLLHDDVIDNSTLRRNKPTVNSIWGDETSVLSGDLIYSTACRLMVKTKSLNLINDFAECIRFMSESELFQLELLWKKDITQEQYERVISGKTAFLFSVSTKTPCYLKKCDKKILKLLEDYGNSIGYAFQIFDDCLDYEGKSPETGKPILTDLLEGKITLPLILSLEKKSDFSKNLSFLVNKILETGEASLNEKEQLIYFVKQSGGLQLAIEKAEFYSQKARDALSKIEKAISLSQKQRAAIKALYEISYFVLNRKS